MVKIIHVILKMQGFVALTCSASRSRVSLHTWAVSNLDAVILVTPGTREPPAQRGVLLKTKNLRTGTCRHVTESMLCKVFGIRDGAGRTGAEEKFQGARGWKIL